MVYLDVTDREHVAVVFEQFRPLTVIHAAAVNPGQGDVGEMRIVNTIGSRNVAHAASAIGARLIAVSTDVVHDGTAAPYADDVEPTPLSDYARTKADAEHEVAQVYPIASIVRTSLMYGLDSMDRGTAGFADMLVRGQPLPLYTDVRRNPIWVETLARALLRLAEVDHTGLINIAGSQAMSRYDYGRALLTYWDIDDRGLIEPALAADVSDEIPLDLRLDSTHAESLLGMTFPGVDEVLASHPRA